MSCAKRCHYGQYNLTQRGLKTMRSILKQNMKIIKNAEKTYFMNFLNVCSDHHM